MNSFPPIWTFLVEIVQNKNYPSLLFTAFQIKSLPEKILYIEIRYQCTYRGTQEPVKIQVVSTVMSGLLFARFRIVDYVTRL